MLCYVQFLSSCVVGESLDDGDEEEQTHPASSKDTFRIIGTVVDKDGEKLNFASEKYSVSKSCILCIFNLLLRF